MGALSRNKGKAFELLVANAFKVLYAGSKRGCRQYRNNTEKEDGRADVEGTPWWIECSHGTRVSVPAKMAQAARSTDGRVPIVVSRLNHQPVFATMRLEDIVAVLREHRIAMLLRQRDPALYEELRAATLPKVDP